MPGVESGMPGVESGMMRCVIGIAAVLSLWAQEPPREQIKKTIANTMQAVQNARTREDIVRAVEGMDLPEWISTGIGEQDNHRDDAIRVLQDRLSTPPGKRDQPHLDFIWWHETPKKVTVLYWVSGTENGVVTGSMARDTWIPTRAGWRRSVHDKLFPNRPLIENGKPVILPPLADHLHP
jgi:hypothetical protein